MTSLVCPSCSQPLDVQCENARCPRCGQLVGTPASPATEAIDIAASGPPPMFSLPPGTAATSDQVITRVTAAKQTTADLPALPEAEPAHFERTMTWSGAAPPADRPGVPVGQEEETELTAFLAPP